MWWLAALGEFASVCHIAVMERANPEPNKDRGLTPFHREDWVFPRHLVLHGVRRANSGSGQREGS